MDLIYLLSVFLSMGKTVATLAFSGKKHDVIQLFKAFETDFTRESDVKIMSVIGILCVLGALFACQDFIVEFTLSGVTSSVEKDKISIWLLFNAFFLILTMLE